MMESSHNVVYQNLVQLITLKEQQIKMKVVRNKVI